MSKINWPLVFVFACIGVVVGGMATFIGYVVKNATYFFMGDMNVTHSSVLLIVGLVILIASIIAGATALANSNS